MAELIPLRRKKRAPQVRPGAARSNPASVANFFEHMHRDTVAVLRHNLRLALRGEVRGVAISVLLNDEERLTFTGKYRDDPGEAVRASARLQWKANCAADEADAEA